MLAKRESTFVNYILLDPTPAPGYTMVGGPSCAPIRSAAPIQVATFKPTGISYAKVTLLPMQSTSGLSSKQAPFNMGKEHQLLKKAGIQPTAEPLRMAHKALEVDDNLEAMKAVLSKHKKFCEFTSTSPIVQNAVASSSSSALPPQPKSSFEDHLKTPTPQDYKDTKKREKRRRQRKRAATKAAKALKAKENAQLPAIMWELPNNQTLGNVKVFPEVSTNLIAENRDSLLHPGNQAAFPSSPSIINPKHPCAKYFRALIELLNMVDDKKYLNNTSLDVDYTNSLKLQGEYEEPLDWGTPSDIEQELEAQDEQSSSDIDDDIASAFQHL